MQLAQIREEINGTTSNSAYPLFSCNCSFLAANSVCVVPAKPQETSLDSCNLASETADATRRTVLNNFIEQLSMQSAQSDPSVGLELGVETTDPRWPVSQGWVKMTKNISGVEIHYVHNTATGASADFKFVP
ncbi:MAG: hypothetical protein HKL80_03265 [Acidimicrobiales bacterium]|nr:hypothetical protein [Acidimicrobiales bacterium]